jgi:glycosyltransferase involved in cell wall biosynthesis
MSQNIVSIIVPTKNELGTIKAIVRTMPRLGNVVEIVFVDGHSTDGTWEAIQQQIRSNKKSWLRIGAYQQKGKGKWDAVQMGMRYAKGVIFMIYDADMSVPIGDLVHFYDTIVSRSGALITGSRFIYPQESGAMRMLNHTGNIIFSKIFSWMLRARITDTLCGTKVMTAKSYKRIMEATTAFRKHDPYGDFTLMLGAAKLGMPIIEVPIAYKARVYGSTKISRFRDGAKLLVVVFHALHDFWRSK